MWNISMHASRTLLRTAVVALCVLPMHGQTANTGAIAGTVSDPSGALVPRAAVVINSQGTGEKRDLGGVYVSLASHRIVVGADSAVPRTSRGLGMSRDATPCHSAGTGTGDHR